MSLNEGAPWGIPARLVLIYGFIAIVVLNMLVFSLNLVLTMGKAKGAQTEEELERLMVPALQGESEAVVGPVRTILAALVAGTLGAMLGGLFVLGVRRL